ncbi:hemolysin family protein [Rothia sp. P7181]|uniref:hemolysin family protein n=1 Tax=unclassified Rothia (in: high G+C Gram-positive bacteria) TaxID=2689056 RepID=UPI003AEA4062
MAFFLLPVLLICFIGCAYVLRAVETAFTYLPSTEMEHLSKERGTNKLAAIADFLDPYIFSIRLWRGIFETFAVVAAFTVLQLLWDAVWISALLTGLVMSAVSYFFFTVAPQKSGRTHPELYVRRFYPVVYFLRFVLGPLPNSVIQRHKDSENEPTRAGYFTEDELKEFVDRASTQSTIENEEAQMVHSIFELDETRIRSVMVPRTDMVTMDIDETLEDAINLFLRSGYSRMPVLGEDFDDIQGFLYLKDVVEATVENQNNSSTHTVASLLRPARFEPESKRVMDLLRQMQRESTHVAIVVDEYGGTAGLVTLEDLIEELVGDISDEYDQETPEIKAEPDGSFKISSRLSVEELGELFDIELDDEEVDTAGGLLSKYLGKVPIIGSQVVVNGIGIRAIGARGRRNQIGTLLVWAADGEKSADNISSSSQGDLGAGHRNI